MRKIISYQINDIQQIRCNLIRLAKQFDYFMLLDSHTDAQYSTLPPFYNNFQIIAAMGAQRFLQINENVFQQIKHFISPYPDWYFLHLSFDAKNEIFNLTSHKPEYMGFPIAFIFEPLWVITICNNELQLHYPYSISDTNAQKFINQILAPSPFYISGITYKKLNFKYISFEKYKHIFQSIQNHIYRGDIYEINFCIHFIADTCQIDPFETYLKLSQYSPAPFAGFYRNKNLFLISASPERYLRKLNKTIISQPIKGTIGRGKTNEEDLKNIFYFYINEKDRAENIMITDLVRNDLSQFAKQGSVTVTDFCSVYTFKHVHQMITTVECKINPAYHLVDTIRLSFPMGSMTGAPKLNALKYIDTFEEHNRSIFSGTIGYINPFNDFDFNVIIRSILYNKYKNLITIPAGSAITAYSNANDEYQECLLKAKALIEVLSS